jgi:hypothetical protein
MVFKVSNAGNGFLCLGAACQVVSAGRFVFSALVCIILHFVCLYNVELCQAVAVIAAVLIQWQCWCSWLAVPMSMWTSVP